MTFTPGKYTKAWAKYRDDRNGFWFLLIMAIPYGMIIVILNNKAFHSSYSYLLMVPYLALWIYFAFRLQFFHCPRCKKPFSGSGWNNKGKEMLAPNCVHCGLPRYAHDDEPPPAAPENSGKS